MVAAKIANLREGSPSFHARITTQPIGGVGISQADAAETLNVGTASVRRARKVKDHGAPELVAAVERGVRARHAVRSRPSGARTPIFRSGRAALLHAPPTSPSVIPLIQLIRSARLVFLLQRNRLPGRDPDQSPATRKTAAESS